MQRPEKLHGLRHVALRVKNLEACEQFYGELLGMQAEWKPDRDNVYLTSGLDNLALHRMVGHFSSNAEQRLDHIGFIVRTSEQVNQWCDFLKANGVPIVREPKTHRDGARSFYCLDPDGNTVQLIYHPPLSK